MSLASSIALIAVLAIVVGSLPGIVFAFTYAPSFKWRALKATRRQVATRSSILNHLLSSHIRKRPGVPSGGMPGRFVVFECYLPSV